MHTYYKYFLVLCIPALLVGCATTVPWEHPNMTLFELQQANAKNELKEPIDPDEMHLWVPASDADLVMRRKRQAKLLRVSGAVDKLILNFRIVKAEGESLENSVASANSRINAINEEILERANQKKKNVEQLKLDTSNIKSSIKRAESDIRGLEKARSVRVVRASYKSHYRKAIRLFRIGKYEKSIKRFQKAMSGNQPRSLEDNIQFGIGSAYYKLKQYPAAINYLDSVIKKYPGQDKWLVAHVLLGMIYGIDGQKSKSMYILEKALKSNPPDNIRKILDRLITITQEENFYANS